MYVRRYQKYKKQYSIIRVVPFGKSELNSNYIKKSKNRLLNEYQKHLNASYKFQIGVGYSAQWITF